MDDTDETFVAFCEGMWGSDEQIEAVITDRMPGAHTECLEPKPSGQKEMLFPRPHLGTKVSLAGDKL